MAEQRIFLLSPAHCGGKRAQLLLNPGASFDLAQRLRAPAGAALADVFSFLSGLYFRGKVAYARAFATSRGALAAAYVITSNRGLLPIDTRVNIEQLRCFGKTRIDPDEPQYRKPLLQTARQLADHSPAAQIVLLGSVATGKYVDVLLQVFGSRLHFPADFAGRGDMSRGGLMLRCVQSWSELRYVPVAGAVRHGKRPPKLQPLSQARIFIPSSGIPGEGRVGAVAAATTTVL